MSDENLISRRGLFTKIGVLFNGLVAVAIAVPIVKFLLSSITRGRGNAYLSWVPLGRTSEFPEGETRLRYFPESLRDADRWQDGGHRVLGAPHRGRSISGFCN